MQAHHAVGQHVFFDHIGQVVGGFLAFLGQAVQTPRQHFHDPAQARGHREHHQRELPIEPQQITDQGQQGEAVAGQADQGRHQLRSTDLNLVHHGVGQGAGRLATEQRQIGAHQFAKQVAAQFFHAVVGHARQRVLRHKVRQTTQAEQANDHQRYGPQRQTVLGKTVVQQRLKQGRNQGLGQGSDQGGPNGQRPDAALTPKIGFEAQQALRNARLWCCSCGGLGGGVGCRHELIDCKQACCQEAAGTVWSTRGGLQTGRNAMVSKH